MRWLIVEDSLQGREGHWFEYIGAFVRELPTCGDEVDLLVSRRAEPFIERELGGRPVLPESAYLKLSDRAPRWRRYGRIPVHGLATFHRVRAYLRDAPRPDAIFVPTVILHHLSGWVALIKTELRRFSGRVLLFFPSLPIGEQDGQMTLDGSPTSRWTRRLLQLLRSEIASGRVTLGVETAALQAAAQKTFDLPFVYFPHPVSSSTLPAAAPKSSLTFAAYGPGRYEKGSELLLAAIGAYCDRSPHSRVRFVVQWTGDFALPGGQVARIPASLRENPRIEVVDRFFADGEYAARLAATDALLLPYRASSYRWRLSRVALEAMVHGLPFVGTAGTTLADQGGEFGAVRPCADGDVASLVEAISDLELNHSQWRAQARAHVADAQRHFSVGAFRRILLG